MGVAVNLYWNGIVKNEQNDVAYKGAKVNVVLIKVFHGTTFSGLSDKIYATTDIDRQSLELNIICRYPISCKEYKPIPIKNDEWGGAYVGSDQQSCSVLCRNIFGRKTSTLKG